MGGVDSYDTAMDNQDAERTYRKLLWIINYDEIDAFDQELIGRFMYKHWAAQAL